MRKGDQRSPLRDLCFVFFVRYLIINYLLLIKINSTFNTPNSTFCSARTLFCKKRGKNFCVYFVFDILLCTNRSAVKAQPRTLCVLKCFAFWLTLTAYLFYYRFALFFFISILLYFSLVGSAHTRSLFVKSEAKTFASCVLHYSLCKTFISIFCAYR